ncbi:YjzC family protein [Salinithrix halophila]|uniref:YjzC family protein n=1 Tax=Salinithrix halophila TaxID=1485204 RepID=A0ABV8JCM5_9BACL
MGQKGGEKRASQRSNPATGSGSSGRNSGSERFKTGEKAPETAKYELAGLVHDTSKSAQGEETIKLEKNEQFPPDPASNEAAYWVKAS